MLTTCFDCGEGYDKLTEVNLRAFLDQVTTRQEDFFAIEMWKKAGYIGEFNLLFKLFSLKP